MVQCPLHENCNFYVPWNGPETATIAVVGEGPGAQELIKGEPFVGPSGDELNKALLAIGLDRKDIFVYNVVPCFNGPDRTPTDRDIKLWKPHLVEVLKKNRPTVIVAAGAWALYALTGKKGIKRHQGVERRVRLAPDYDPWVVPMFHPAYCLRIHDFRPLRDGLSKAGRLLTQTSLPDWLPGYTLVEDEFILSEAVEELSDAPALAFDNETAGPLYEGGTTVMVGLGEPGKKPYIFVLDHPEMQPDIKDKLQAGIRTIFNTNKGVRIAHNGKYDVQWLKRDGLLDANAKGETWDTMYVAHLLDESRADRGRLKLKEGLGIELFGVESYWLKEIEVTNTLKSGKTKQVRLTIGELLKQGRAKEIPLHDLADYNARDVFLTLRVYEKLRPELDADPALTKVFNSIVMPTSWAMERMERIGLPVDLAKLGDPAKYQGEIDELDEESLGELDKKYLADRRNLEEQMDGLVTLHLLANTEAKQGPLLWSSPKQVGHLLYEVLKLPVMRRTEPTEMHPHGQASTDDDALALIRGYHPIVSMIQQWRKLKKALETVETLRSSVAPDGRIHPTFVIAGPSTGRTSSRDPNVQNLQRGPGIRDGIRAREGYKLVEVDLSLIEMRWGAYIYQEPTMKRLLKEEGRDLHTYTASKAFGVSEDRVSKPQRQLGKTANFLLLYGGGPNKLAAELRSTGMGQNEAAQTLATMGKLQQVPDAIQYVALELHKAFHRAYPGIGVAHGRIRKEIERDQLVRSVFGRIRHVPEIRSLDREIKESAARAGSNTLVQGPASDTNLLGLIKVDELLLMPYGANLIDAVHDSILAEVPDQYAMPFATAAKSIIENPPLKAYGITDFDIPILAEVKIGQSWGSMNKMENVPDVPKVPLSSANGPIPPQPVTNLEHYADIGDSVYAAAALYRSKGWSFIPLTSPKSGNGHDTSVGKLPIPGLLWKEYQKRMPTETEQAAWFAEVHGKNPFNIAILTGSISKLVVLDIDSKKHPEAEEWLAKSGLNSPIKVRTGGGGLHLFYYYDGEPLSNSAGQIAPGVDIRAEGGYVVGPPSMHMSGMRYRWLTPEGCLPLGDPIPTIPEWLLEKIKTKKELPKTIPVSGERVIPQDKADAIVDLILPYYQAGQRHNLILALAGFLLKRNYRYTDVESLITQLVSGAGDTEDWDRQKAMATTQEKVTSGELASGSAALIDLIGREPVEKLQDLFGSVHASGSVKNFTALDVAYMDIKQEDWLIEGLLPKAGIAMLSGHPGAGKTTFIIQTGLQMAAGQHVFGEFPVPKPFKVLYFQADNPPNMVRRLIKNMVLRGRVPNEAAERFIVAEVVKPIKISDPEGYGIVEQQIALYEPDLLILDTIRDFHSADENNPTAVSETIDALKRLRGTRTMAIVYIHHHSKSPQGIPRGEIERHMGSMRFVTPVDLSMALTFPQDDASKVKLSFPKVRWAPKPASRYFRRVDDWYYDEGPVTGA